MQIGADDLMRARRCISDGAGDLPVFDPLRQRRKRLGARIAPLLLQRFPADGAPVETRRRAGLQPPHGEASGAQAAGKAERRRIAHPARGRPLVADMDHTAQKGAGRDHNGAGADFSGAGGDSRDPLARDDQILD